MIRKNVSVGEVITIEPFERHSFNSKNGAIIEEISSTHYVEDSFIVMNQLMLIKIEKPS